MAWIPDNSAGQWSQKSAEIAGFLGGAISIAVYAGISMSGILGAVTQVAGALGIIAIALLAYAHIAK